MPLDNQVTILIPTSPIPRHPDTSLIDECIGAIRDYFPAARLVIMSDGVRPSVEHRRHQYEEYRKRLSDKIVYCSAPTQLSIALDPEQQVRMLRETLKLVKTPLVLFVEHDAILRRDPEIEWTQIFEILQPDCVNLVRFYNWDKAPWHEHQHLMCGDLYHGTLESPVRFIKTVQFSGWPFVARTEYLKYLVDSVPQYERKMLETALYYRIAGEPWEQNKMVIYAPENAQTFIHRDGRVDQKTGYKDVGEW